MNNFTPDLKCVVVCMWEWMKWKPLIFLLRSNKPKTLAPQGEIAKCVTNKAKSNLNKRKRRKKMQSTIRNACAWSTHISRFRMCWKRICVSILCFVYCNLNFRTLWIQEISMKHIVWKSYISCTPSCEKSWKFNLISCKIQ